jgi:hypothetical protein
MEGRLAAVGAVLPCGGTEKASLTLHLTSLTNRQLSFLRCTLLTQARIVLGGRWFRSPLFTYCDSKSLLHRLENDCAVVQQATGSH